MTIKVKPHELQSKAAYAASIAQELNEKADQVKSIYHRLDSEVRSRRGIGSSIRSLQSRIDRAQQKMYNISRFLGMAAERYNAAEAGVVARAASLGSVASLNVGVCGVGAVNAGAYKGTAQGKVEGKKWYQANWFKLAVGAAVVGAAVAVAVTVGGPILIGAAVGAAMGAGVGGVIGGISSAASGGKFIDGFANGFMVGSISGALSGAASGAGFGLITGAAVDGAIDSAVYAGETLYNGEEVTAAGVLTSFVVGAGFSAIGTVVSNKISGVISKNVDEAVESVGNFKSWSDFSKYSDEIGKSTLLTTDEKIAQIQKAFNSVIDKTDINVPIDSKYIKGFSADGKVIYDWPKYLGFEKNTIESVSRPNVLPEIWDRYGYMGGSNFSDVPVSGKYTYSERAIPYVKNEAAYHTGAFNNATYFDKIDAIKSGDMDSFNKILENEGIQKVNTDYFENLQDTYADFIADTTDAIGTNIDVTYGLKGKAASWGDMEGGAGQIVTPFGGNVLSRIGIIQ